MNKLVKTIAIALFAVASFAVNAQNNTNDNALIGKARAAAHDCLQEVAGADINASVQETGICFVSGTTHSVTFSAQPKCPGNGPCPYFARLVAKVDFDCDGNVSGVTCY